MSIHLAKSLEDRKDALYTKLGEDYSCKHADKLGELMQNCLCLRNNMLTEFLNTSAKTSIGYMKRLEVCGLVTGHSCGRKKLYINRHLLPIIMEAAFYGEKK